MKPPDAPLLAAHDVVYQVGAQTILHGLSLDVAAGEFVSLIGPNGAGKTTFLKCLDGILTPRSGHVTLNGKELRAFSRKEWARWVSYVPQADSRALPFSVRDFVLMGRYPHLSPFSSIRPEDHHAVHEALDLTGTLGLSERLLGTLSGGERQKVYLAAALAQGARVLLLDEPTTFLDPRYQSEIIRILHHINRAQGVTIVSVTHDLNLAALVSDRLVAVRLGHIEFAGTPEQVMSPAVLRRVYEKDFQLVPHPQTGRAMIVPEAVA